MHLKKKSFLLFLIALNFLISFDYILYADGGLEKETPYPIGNFSLPISQQPGCLFGLGQRIVEKNDSIIGVFPTILKGKKKNLTIVDPYILYGIRNDLSFLLNIPIDVRAKNNDNHSSGISDLFPVLEYAYYDKPTRTTYDQATIVGGVTLSTGSSAKVPNTGFGSSAFFLGFTGFRLTERFYYFGSAGTLQTTTDNYKNKFGSYYLYQFGGSVNLGDWVDGWIFALGLEFNGIFTERDKIAGITNPNSGGNVIFLGPSFWASSKEFILQIGLQGNCD